jgi:hypothetical protein
VESGLELTGQAGPDQIRDAEIAPVQNLGRTGATVVTHLLAREA